MNYVACGSAAGRGAVYYVGYPASGLINAFLYPLSLIHHKIKQWKKIYQRGPDEPLLFNITAPMLWYSTRSSFFAEIEEGVDRLTFARGETRHVEEHLHEIGCSLSSWSQRPASLVSRRILRYGHKLSAAIASRRRKCAPVLGSEFLYRWRSTCAGGYVGAVVRVGIIIE